MNDRDYPFTEADHCPCCGHIYCDATCVVGGTTSSLDDDAHIERLIRLAKAGGFVLDLGGDDGTP
jgi:hypothetical protein